MGGFMRHGASGFQTHDSTGSARRFGDEHGMISWAGTGTNDHAATAAYHRKIAAFHRAWGETDRANANDKVAEKYEKKAARASKGSHFSPKYGR